jgi:hypothetical protein
VSESIQAYPLAWPPGWRRATQRKRSSFSKGRTVYGTDSHYERYEALTVPQATERVLAELRRMVERRLDLRQRTVVISTNVVLTKDGFPRGGQRAPEDPGAAVYWGHGKTRRCMAIDRYDRVADNLAAIAATLSAMRAIERHGGAEILDRAFTGFTALPNPEQPWQVLGLPTSSPTADQVREAHRALAMKHHPDRGGDAQTMARINAARDDLLSQMGI